MAKKKTTVEKLADLEAKTEKSPEDLKQIDELKLQVEIEEEEAEKKAKEEAEAKAAKEKKAKEEAAKAKDIPEDLHRELGEVLKIKLRLENKPEKFKLQDKFDKLGKEAEKYDGLKAKKNQTIHFGTDPYFFTKDYPNPKSKTDLANDKQRKQYFQ